MAASSHLTGSASLGKAFLRNSTGLVREVGLFDAFTMNTLGMNVAVGAVVIISQAPGDFSGGSMLVATIIGTLLMAFTLLYTYAEFAAAMPRSGGDYIFVSRALHPILGWLLSWSQGIWLTFFWIGFNAWFALTSAVPTALDTIGSATGQHGWFAAANGLIATFGILGIHTEWWVLLFGVVINVLFGVLLIAGGQVYWRWQRVLFLFAGGMVLAWIVLLLVASGGFHGTWNGFAGKFGTLTYNQIIPTAEKAGFHAGSGGFNFIDTILMLPWVFFVVGYAQGSAQIGGEIKRASRTQYQAMVGGVLVNGAILAIIIQVAVSNLGGKWLSALSYLSNNDPSKLGMPGGLVPGLNLLASLMTHNVIFLLFLGIGFVVWALMGTPLSELQATRYMLAWALDRTAPSGLGTVNDQFHTPARAIALCTVAGTLALIILVTIPQASLLGALLAQILAFVLVSFAGVVFPYRLHDVWLSAGGRRIFGIPAVTLAGAGGVVCLGGLLAIFVGNGTVSSAFAVTHTLSIAIMIGVVVLGALWYVGAYLLNRRRGVDLGLVYREIPPE